MTATTLLYEATSRPRTATRWPFQCHSHLLSCAVRARCWLVIDRVRRRQAHKRGGAFDFTTLDTEMAEDCAQPERLGDLGDALEELAALEPELAG